MKQETHYGFDLDIPRQTMPECTCASKRISGQWFRQSCPLASYSNDMTEDGYGGDTIGAYSGVVVRMSGYILPMRSAKQASRRGAETQEAYMRPKIFALGMFVLGLTACDVTSTVTEGSKQARAVESSLEAS